MTPTSRQPPEVTVLIATCNRPELLARALESVRSQTVPAMRVVVVDDSEARHRDTNRHIVAEIRRDGVKYVYLHNSRTPGPSGTWNTGLKWLAKAVQDPAQTIVAILDDDDAWAPGHLAACNAVQRAGDADMVVSGLLRHEAYGQPPRAQTIPNALVIDELLVRSPHIQGSNLYVRLSRLLEAGCFDEDLPSVTDRDLCIRLACLPELRFANTDVHTVHHHAEPSDRPRLSTRQSPERQLGLDRFYAKYSSWMTPEIEAEFLDRAFKLFGYRPPAARLAASTTAEAPRPTPATAPTAPAGRLSDLTLVVGIIGEPSAHLRIERLLSDLLALSRDPRVTGVDVYILENGNEEAGYEFEAMIDRARAAGLRVHVVTRTQQVIDAGRGLFGGKGWVPRGRVGIGRARTMLQRYVYTAARRKPGAVAWLLDDDKRLEALAHQPGLDCLEVVPVPYVDLLETLKATGVDVALGIDTDAPPLPFASATRTQLVDLHHTLRALARRSPDDRVSPQHRDIVQLAARLPDYYYDLSRTSTRHLEVPFSLLDQGATTARAAFAGIAEEAHRIMAGQQVTRPLFVSSPITIGSLVPSVRRGGSTFIFDLEALRRTPDISFELGGREARRSEMMWSVVARYCHGTRIVQTSVPVRHDRSDVRVKEVDFDKLVDDARGYALYSALQVVLLERCEARSLDGAAAIDDLAFGPEDTALFVRKYRKYLGERRDAFVLSFHRCRGLASAIRSMLRPSGHQRPFWLDDPRCAASVCQLENFVDELERGYSLERLYSAVAALDEVDEVDLIRFLDDLRQTLGSSTDIPDEATRSARAYIDEQRVLNARVQVQRLAGVAELRRLGAGAEGTVFTDGTWVYKYFDYRKAGSTASLEDMSRRLSTAQALQPIRLIVEHPHVVLVYAYEPSEPYEGGHGPGLVRLLQDCVRVGLACRNLHPKNLRVVGEAVRLVDYGADVVPLDDHQLEQMCRRAWLCWRWAGRPDLDDLLRRSLRDATLPELCGYQALRGAVLDRRTKEQVLDGLVVEQVLRAEPTTVLDFGCGKGRLAVDLAKRGMTVTAYDPDLALPARWPSHHGVTWSSALPAGRAFDAVVCSLVICTLTDEQLRAGLRAIRRSGAEDGVVTIAVCNPAFTTVKSTGLQTKHIPAGQSPSESFAWTKILRDGTARTDMHRPLGRLTSEFARAGLRVLDWTETSGVDHERFEYASDFLVVRAAPMPEPVGRVSLLVKTCAMEAKTVGLQVRHLVRQLERSVVIAERILAVDSRTSGFPRPWAEPDAVAHLEACQALVREGVVDKIVVGPTSAEAAAELNVRWFGHAATGTHAANGAQLSVVLAGLEACAGDYVLHVDADVLIVADESATELADVVAALDRDDRAVTAAVPIVCADDRAWSAYDGSAPWRVETRAGVLHRARLLAARPLVNTQAGDTIQLPWHRSLDATVLRDGLRSRRGGGRRLAFVHPTNDRKADVHELALILDQVERGRVPPVQLGQVDLQGTLSDWLGPKRTEDFIFLVTLRDVEPGRWRRCWESIRGQRGRSWGAVIVDDGSDAARSETVEAYAAAAGAKVTVLRTRWARGKLANLLLAMDHICVNAQSVIINVDGDDMLLSDEVLERIGREYDRGADLTVGAMLRTDKPTSYSVDLRRARENPASNVWVHPRTFRRYLLDRVPREYFLVDGAYPRVANDWALMLPLVEVADAPVVIDELLYLHEPSGAGKGAERAEREAIIGKLRAMKSLRRSA